MWDARVNLCEQNAIRANGGLRDRFSITVISVATDMTRNESCLATERMKAYMV